jgi:hypothetical protein
MSAFGRAAGIVLVVGVLVSACRFEKRPDLTTNYAASDTPYGSSIPPGSSVEDSARAVLVAVSDAFGLGDEARVAQLTTPDVILFDQAERVRWISSEAAARLPPALLGAADGLGRHLVESSFFWLGSDAVFFSLRYQASPSVDPLPWTAVESWVLVRTDAGWRVRYLHRSRGLTESGSLP